MVESTTSVDLSEFYAEQSQPALRCSVGKALIALDPDDVNKLRAALAAPDITGKAISTWCHKHDTDVGAQAVVRHRRGECKCQPTT